MGRPLTPEEQHRRAIDEFCGVNDVSVTEELTWLVSLGVLLLLVSAVCAVLWPLVQLQRGYLWTSARLQRLHVGINPELLGLLCAGLAIACAATLAVLTQGVHQ